MGKFSDALKKAETSKGKQPVGEVTEELVQVPHEEISAMRLDTDIPEAVPSSSWQSPGKIDPCLVSLLEPNTAAAECFKILRAKLLFTHNGPACRAVMVSSPQSSDGKTMVAARQEPAKRPLWRANGWQVRSRFGKRLRLA